MSFRPPSTVERDRSVRSYQTPASLQNYTPASLQDYTPASGPNFTPATPVASQDYTPAISAADSYEEAGCDSRHQTCAAAAATATLFGTAAALFGAVSGDRFANFEKANAELARSRQLAESGDLAGASRLFKDHSPVVLNYLLGEGRMEEARDIVVEEARLHAGLGEAIVNGEITSDRPAGGVFEYAGSRLKNSIIWYSDESEARETMEEEAAALLEKALKAYEDDRHLGTGERLDGIARVASGLSNLSDLPEIRIRGLIKLADLLRDEGYRHVIDEHSLVAVAAGLRADRSQYREAAVLYERAYVAVMDKIFNEDRLRKYGLQAAEMWYRADDIDAALAMARFAAADRGIDPDMHVLRGPHDAESREIELLSILTEVYRARLGLRPDGIADNMDQTVRARAIEQLLEYYSRLYDIYSSESLGDGITPADRSDYRAEMGLVASKMAEIERMRGRYGESAGRFAEAGRELGSPELLIEAARDSGRIKDQKMRARLIAEAAFHTKDHARRADLLMEAVNAHRLAGVINNESVISFEGWNGSIADLMTLRLDALLKAWRAEVKIWATDESRNDAALLNGLSAGSRRRVLRLLMQISAAFDTFPGEISLEDRAERGWVETQLDLLARREGLVAGDAGPAAAVTKAREADILRLAGDISLGGSRVAEKELVRAAGRWLEDEIGRQPPEDVIKGAFMGRGEEKVVAAVGRLFEGRPDVAFRIRRAFEMERGAEAFDSKEASRERRGALERVLEAAKRPLEMAAKK